MTSDQFWQLARYILLIVGTTLVSRGVITKDQLTLALTDLPTIAGTCIAAGSALWGFYVKWNTKAVPVETAARSDVPTVSAATGAVQSPQTFRG